MRNENRFLKYPGTKITLVKDIQKEFAKSGRRIFVDVFGGSGSVSLNMQAEQIVYNDIDPELVSIFKAVKMHPEEFYSEMCIMTESESDFLTYGSKPVNWKNKKVRDAGISFHNFTTGFGGKGETYSTREKGAYQYTVKVMQNYNIIAKKVKEFTIENLDFREIIAKYDDSDSFFYIDPPYPGRNWYNFSFSMDDMKDLKAVLSKIKGIYLMNFNRDDPIPKEIFGNPQYTIKYENRNAPPDQEYRYFAYYTNLKKK